jgi:LAO/AO transport system kinase
VVTCSSVNGDGLDTIWNEIELFREHCLKTGILETRRHEQIQEWVWSMAHESLIDAFSRSAGVADAWVGAKAGIERGELSAPGALRLVLDAFRFPVD